MNLLIGFRQGLVDAFRKGQKPYLVWPGKSLLPKKRAFPLLDLPFPRTYSELALQRAALESRGPFERVIPCTEAAVPIAAALQRLWNCPGPTALQFLRCHDKVLMKRFLRGTPMTPFIPHRPGLDAQGLIAALGRPVVCKERGESGSRSLHFCDDAKTLTPLIGPGKLYERFVAAPELSIETFRSRGRTRFCSMTQYYERQRINIVPALLSEDEEAKLRAFNEKILDQLGIQEGLTHLEVYRSEGGPLFGEIALRPPGGYIMDLIAIAYGFQPWEAFASISCGQEFDFPKRPRQWAAAHIFHPGPGELLALHGWEAIRRDPSVVKAKLKVKQGERISRRIGLGQDIGYILQRGKDPEALMEAVWRVRSTVEFEVAT